MREAGVRRGVGTGCNNCIGVKPPPKPCLLSLSLLFLGAPWLRPPEKCKILIHLSSFVFSAIGL